MIQILVVFLQNKANLNNISVRAVHQLGRKKIKKMDFCEYIVQSLSQCLTSLVFTRLKIDNRCGMFVQHNLVIVHVLK